MTKLTDQDWSGLAGHGRTLVIYMGLATAPAIADKLIADGVSPGLPVAVVERGTTKDARVLRTLLTDLGDLDGQAGRNAVGDQLVGDGGRGREAHVDHQRAAVTGEPRPVLIGQILALAGDEAHRARIFAVGEGEPRLRGTARRRGRK